MSDTPYSFDGGLLGGSYSTPPSALAPSAPSDIDIRRQALEMAMRLDISGRTGADVVADARLFEAYLTDGRPSGIPVTTAAMLSAWAAVLDAPYDLALPSSVADIERAAEVCAAMRRAMP